MGVGDDTPNAKGYELSCTDCPFEAIVYGTSDEALELADKHQNNNGDTPGDHFVELELTELEQ